MESLRVERLDHLGVIASVIKDIGLSDMINARLVPDAQEVITPGEAMAGMILNGLGFANRPLSLPPQFFAHKPLALVWREGMHAEMFQRFPLARPLDEAYADGCELCFPALALAVCAQAGLALRFNPRDPTSLSLSGADVPARDAQAMSLTHGDARAHRPALQQAVLDLLVSPAGGVPWMRQSWDGHTSDRAVFHERAQALRAALQHAPRPRELSADSQLDPQDKAPPSKNSAVSPVFPTPLVPSPR
jgi:transposase